MKRIPLLAAALIACCALSEARTCRTVRGAARLTEISSLPVIDKAASTGYVGSIDKKGGNEDWNWDWYQDEKGDWILFETFGPGCIYNFTQHRYPTSSDTEFKIYIDDPDTPAFVVKKSDFGTAAPFLPPIADTFHGPDDGILVTRDFLPMEYGSYCKITSNDRLYGSGDGPNEGGWGHVIYTSYDKPSTGKAGDWSIYDRLGEDPKPHAANRHYKLSGIKVEPKKTVVALDTRGRGSVGAIRIRIQKDSTDNEILRDLRVRMFWDGSSVPAVDAPIGTLIGCEYCETAGRNTQLLLGIEVDPCKYVKGYNYFPMPYWKSARIELYSMRDKPILVEDLEIETTPSRTARYSKRSTGYFTSSAYHELQPNVYLQNSRIADVSGSGHMVYGVLSGKWIEGPGCEGDVRVFFDGRRTPEIESDGSESWASYGWGFELPPQATPFSGYHGQWRSNLDWSMVRLCIGDSYHFRQSLSFELEHGAWNNGMGMHSGQVFCYLKPADGMQTDSFAIDDEASLKAHGYAVDGEYHTEQNSSAYANGINDANAFSAGVACGFTGPISFNVAINRNNDGAILFRTSSQAAGRQRAKIAVDGKVLEKPWFYGEDNPYYSWLDDSYAIPAKYTRGKKSLKITITPEEVGGQCNWNESAWRVLTVARKR